MGCNPNLQIKGQNPKIFEHWSHKNHFTPNHFPSALWTNNSCSRNFSRFAINFPQIFWNHYERQWNWLGLTPASQPTSEPQLRFIVICSQEFDGEKWLRQCGFVSIHSVNISISTIIYLIDETSFIVLQLHSHQGLWSDELMLEEYTIYDDDAQLRKT